MSLIQASINNRERFKTVKNKKMFEKHISTLSVSKGLKYKSRFCRETQYRACLSYSDSFLPLNPELSELEVFPEAHFTPLTFSSLDLFSKY